jgi:hypothetical protein
MSETWLPSLKTATPQEGFDLATKLARVGVKATQPSAEIRDRLRPAYDHDSAQLIAASQVIAIHFQTIAAANTYWREGEKLSMKKITGNASPSDMATPSAIEMVMTRR